MEKYTVVFNCGAKRKNASGPAPVNEDIYQAAIAVVSE